MAEVDDRVKGLKAGSDDYLTKPFAFAELLARVEALNRRGKGEGPVTKLVVEDLELDLLSRQVKRAGQKIDLQPREFRLLEYLMRHAGQVVTRTMLLEGVWDYHFDPQTNVIDVHVSRLRQKVDKPFPTGADPHRAQRRLHVAGGTAVVCGAGAPSSYVRRRPTIASTIAERPWICGLLTALGRLRHSPAPSLAMIDRGLFRSAGFRFGAIYALLLAVSATALALFLWWATAGLLDRQTEAAINADAQGLAERWADGGLPALVVTIEDRLAQNIDDDAIYLLTDPNMNRIAGNLASWPPVVTDTGALV